ncbi:response regulator [Labilibacter marinus]|uniref:response regulator n=1 Tax=Labilibacter marinus TaxID=1477105 RepID=UPI00082B3BBB|nr:response regulator transcription factor [Labilibacter marinus]
MIRVSITDDHDLFRSGVASLFNDIDTIEVVAQTGSGEELLEVLKQQEVDVALVDISMKKMNGLDTVVEMKKHHPHTKAIMLTMHNDSPYVLKALRNGASGYLLKDCDEDELIRAIEEVHKGKRYVNQEVSEIILDAMHTEEEVKSLSNREIEILVLVAQGKTAKQIAQELFISTRTVETHRRNMMKKLKAQNTVELVNKATSLGLL